MKDDKSILSVCADFYQSLFQDDQLRDIDKAVTDDSFESITFQAQDEPYAFFLDDLSLKLKKNETEMLQQEVSLEDLRESIMHMKTGK